MPDTVASGAQGKTQGKPCTTSVFYRGDVSMVSLLAILRVSSGIQRIKETLTGEVAYQI